MGNSYTDGIWERMDAVMGIIDAFGGEFSGEVGHVLADLALLSGIDYKAISATVIIMEQEGFVEVDRYTHPDPHRANKIVSIRRAS